MRLRATMALAFSGLAACAEGGAGAHKSGPAERACYDALANTHAYQEEITFVRTRDYTEEISVTLRDSRGDWICNATRNGHVTELEPV
jgi:hypothetical protein